MRDYAELVKALRCCSKIDARNNGCDSCPYEYCGEDFQNLCGSAADAIEELLAAVPKWISVEEQLPETWKNVLTYGRSGISIDCQALAGGWVFGNHVTHWMPLPEPPKEEKLNKNVE